MKVLFMPSWFETDEAPNSGIFFSEQAQALQQSGHDVTIAIVDVLNYPYRSKSPKYRIIHETRHGMEVYRMVVPSFMTGHVPGLFYSYYAFFYKKLFRHMLSKGLTFDIMYAHSFWHAGYIATILKKEYRLPLIVQEHRSMLMTGEFSDKVNPYLKATVTHSDRFYCVSSRLRDSVYRRTGLTDGIEILPNMVDELFRYRPLENKRFTFVFVGTLNDRKRVIQLIRCFETLRGRHDDVFLRIAGDGPLRSQAEKMIADSDLLRPSAVILGFLPKPSVYELLAEAHVLVLPSAFEPFGVVCIEAMATGRPVICSKNGATDFVNDDNGILIDVDADDQLIAAMESVYANYRNYDLRRISETCVDSYSAESVMRRLTAAMTDIVSTGSDSL